MSVYPTQGRSAVCFAPARINLIGEHIDYTQGRVLPASLVLGTRVTIEPRSEPALTVHSMNLNERVVVPLPIGSRRRRGHWSDYVSGVAWALEQLGVTLQGAQLRISSDVPLGAGLASSAALEVASALALLQRVDRELPALELAFACQRAESDWVGARCGPMDQLIALCGRPHQALLIDCASLESSAASNYLPMQPGSWPTRAYITRTPAVNTTRAGTTVSSCRSCCAPTWATVKCCASCRSRRLRC